jgi:hypothetical protein
VRAHDDRRDLSEQGLADDSRAPLMLPGRELQVGRSVRAGDDRHRAIRRGDQGPDEAEHLGIRDLEAWADLRGSVDDDLNAESPGQQDVFDRDSLSGARLPNRRERAICSSVTPS